MNPTDLVPVPAATLKLGQTLEFTLYDSAGRLLLAKGQRIQTSQQLQLLQSQPLLADDVVHTQTVRAMMSSFDEAARSDAPIKDLDGLARKAARVQSTEREQPERPPASLSQAWTDVESGLRAVLGNLALGGAAALEAVKRLEMYAQRIQMLMAQKRDASLFILFNRSVTGFANYSTLHSLLCAAVACDCARRLPVSESETRSLMHAALTMNVSVKSLQDQMAVQKAKPTQDQLLAVDRHSHESCRLLEAAGVTDPLWLMVVAHHHDDLPPCTAINDRPTEDKLTKILQVIDRYTAVMSPRGTRSGREAKEAVKAVIRTPGVAEHDEVGLDLMQHLGLYPSGTYVQLVRGEVAVVLHPGRRPQTPVVATVLNRQGEPMLEHRIADTSQADWAIASGVSGSTIRVRLNEDRLLRLLTGRAPADS